MVKRGDTVWVVNTEISENGVGTVVSACKADVTVKFHDTQKIGKYVHDPNKIWFILKEKN
jgi:hypothetical protein